MNIAPAPRVAAPAALVVVALCVVSASAAECPATHDALQSALKASVAASGGPKNGGLENNEWAALATSEGVICAVAFSGDSPRDQWAGSRAIAAEKATTAFSLSLDTFALSTANLYAPSQPGGPLYSLIGASPPDGAALSAGDPKTYGSAQDPLVGHKSGGVIVFGGGLALYGPSGMVGALGVSGDTSCADHNVAWRVRAALRLDNPPAGVAKEAKDAIIYDIGPNKKSASGYGHPECGGKEAEIAEQIHAGVLPQWAKVMQAPK